MGIVKVEKTGEVLGTNCDCIQAVMSDEMLNKVIKSRLEINHRWLDCWVP